MQPADSLERTIQDLQDMEKNCCCPFYYPIQEPIFSPGVYSYNYLYKEEPKMEKKASKVQRHGDLCDELHKLYERKNHDYGDSFHQTFLEEGYAMARIRLSDKLGRFKTLTKKLEAGEPAAVTDESIRDTLIDLANYALMTILEMEE